MLAKRQAAPSTFPNKYRPKTCELIVRDQFWNRNDDATKPVANLSQGSWETTSREWDQRQVSLARNLLTTDGYSCSMENVGRRVRQWDAPSVRHLPTSGDRRQRGD